MLAKSSFEGGRGLRLPKAVVDSELARLHQANTTARLQTLGARMSDRGTRCRLGDKCPTEGASAAGDAAP